jgi:hypothetical protein
VLISRCFKIHLLIFGNSQARDFVNALGTTSQIGNYEILYRDDFNGCVSDDSYKELMIKLIEDADNVVFGSAPQEKCWNGFKQEWTKKIDKVLILGEKNFGLNLNAIMVKNVSNEELFNVRESVIESNTKAQKVFMENFVDMNALIGLSSSKVPILDSSGFLISQDGTHLTPKGAEFLGKKIEGSVSFAFTK